MSIIRSGKRIRTAAADFCRRDALEIVVDILRLATGGTTRQKTMMMVVLNFEQAKRYLSLLISWDFLEYHPSSKLFRTTPKGTAFLKAYENVSTMLAMATNQFSSC